MGAAGLLDWSVFDHVISFPPVRTRRERGGPLVRRPRGFQRAVSLGGNGVQLNLTPFQRMTPPIGTRGTYPLSPPPFLPARTEGFLRLRVRAGDGSRGKAFHRR